MGTRQELGERREEHREKELMPGKRAGGLLALTRQLPCAEALKVLILQKPQEVHEGGVTPWEQQKNSKGFLELIFFSWKGLLRIPQILKAAQEFLVLIKILSIRVSTINWNSAFPSASCFGSRAPSGGRKKEPSTASITTIKTLVRSPRILSRNSETSESTLLAVQVTNKGLERRLGLPNATQLMPEFLLIQQKICT